MAKDFRYNPDEPSRRRERQAHRERRQSRDNWRSREQYDNDDMSHLVNSRDMQRIRTE